MMTFLSTIQNFDSKPIGTIFLINGLFSLGFYLFINALATLIVPNEKRRFFIVPFEPFFWGFVFAQILISIGRFFISK